MADFATALAATLESERYPGYVCDPLDKGGETVAGITRRDNPSWAGWKCVDAVRTRLGLQGLAIITRAACADVDAELLKVPGFRQAVQNLYKPKYWDPLALDKEPDQVIGNKIFDVAVWQGVGAAKQAYAGIGGGIA